MHDRREAAREPSWERGLAALTLYIRSRGTADVPPRAMAASVLLGQWVAARREEFWSGTLDPTQAATLHKLPGWTWGTNSYREPEHGATGWAGGWGALRRYIEVHGTATPPPETSIRGIRVGLWVGHQRTRYWAGTLTPERITRLQTLPGWTWTHPEQWWEQGLRAAQDFITANGTSTAATTTVIDGFPIGQWIQRARQDYRTGNLTPTQISALQALPGWHWGPRHQRWSRGLAVLTVYANTHGHAHPPQDTITDSFPLGRWVTDRRTAHRKGTLTPEQIHTLQTLPGWTWNTREQSWSTGLAALSAYADAHGTAAVPYRAQQDGSLLGQWAARQRAAYRAGRLTPPQITALQALPGWSWTSNTASPRRPHSIGSPDERRKT